MSSDKTLGSWSLTSWYVCIICYLASKARRLSWAYIYKWNKLIFWLHRNALHNFLTNPGFTMRPATFETEFVHKYTTSWYFQGFPKVNHHPPPFSESKYLISYILVPSVPSHPLVICYRYVTTESDELDCLLLSRSRASVLLELVFSKGFTLV